MSNTSTTNNHWQQPLMAAQQSGVPHLPVARLLSPRTTFPKTSLVQERNGPLPVNDELIRVFHEQHVIKKLFLILVMFAAIGQLVWWMGN